MELYADRPMDLADASLVVAAESVGTRKVFTVDRNAFERPIECAQCPTEICACSHWQMTGRNQVLRVGTSAIKDARTVRRLGVDVRVAVTDLSVESLCEGWRRNRRRN
jgi:hypothetical protein